MDPIRILILEDNPADAELAEYTLKSAGLNFIFKLVETEAQYRRQLKEFQPDIIISDFDLINYNGVKAFRLAKREKPDVPFILFTGAIQEEKAIEILIAGATDYVMKSRMERLVPAVERALKEAQEHKNRKEAEAERDQLFKEMEERVRERTQDLQKEINERKKAEQALERDLDAMTRLQKIGSLSALKDGIEVILIEIVDAAIAISGADFGNIQLFDAVTGDLRIVAQRGFPPWWIEFWNSVAKGRGACGTALERGERVIVEDVELSPIFIGTPALDIQLKAGVRAVQSTPLVSRSGKPVGMFSTHYRTPRRPDASSLRLIDLLARQAADLIENAIASDAIRGIQDLRRRAEDEIRDREGQLRALIENVQSGVAFIDRGGKFTIVNPAFLRMFGLSETDSISNVNDQDWGNWQVFDSDGTLLNVDEHPVRKAAMTGKPVKDRLVGVKLPSGGDLVWMLISADPIFSTDGGVNYTICTYHDITERIRTEGALRLSEETFSKTFKSATSAMSLRRIADGRILDVNDRWLELMECSREEALGKTLDELGIYQDPGDWAAMLSELRTKGFVLNHESSFRNMRGHERTVMISIQQVTIGGEQIAVGSSIDITERKRTEEEYRLIVEKAPVAIYEIDFRGPRFKSVNDAMSLILGYTRQELLNMNPLDILDEESKGLVKQRIKRILAGNPVEQSVAYSITARDGRKIWAELDIKIKDPASGFVIARDVTERKLVEKALQASEEKFSKAFRYSPNAITITRLSDGRIIEGNESAYELFGYTHEEVLGKTTAELNIWANLDDRQRLVRGLASKGFIQNDEYVLQKKDGTLIYVNLSASLITIDNQQCFLCSFVDVTERKRAEIALLESEQKFRSVLENSRDAIFRVNIQSGRYEYISPSAGRIVGYTPEELMTIDVEAAMEMVHPDDLPALKAALAYSEDMGHAEAEYRQKTKDGQYIWISNRMSVTRDAAGNPLYRDGIIRNITERKRAEEDLKRKTAELESAVAEMDSYTYSVSHDLKAPLRAIDGFSRMLLKEAGDRLDHEDARKLHVISRNSEKMGQLIDDLLKFSRTGRVEIRFDQLNIKSAVEDIWREIVAGNPDRNMQIVIGNLPPARGDWTLLRQVLSNLIGNAVKFTKNKDTAVINITGSNAAEFNTYCVKDNGAGFDMKYYDKLFEIFRRLHSENQYEGTGVGLAIVKKIIERHGGRIWAESKPGEGAAFYFTLPAAMPARE